MSWDEYPLIGRNPSRQEDPYSWLHKPPKQSNALKRATDPKQPAGERFLDPNLFSINGTTALSFSASSESRIYMVYGVSRSGSNSQTIYVRRTDSPHTKSAADGGKRGENPGRMEDTVWWRERALTKALAGLFGGMRNARG
ncbi:hypothetical protein PGT21_023844 [Puccinia graminis f. sp. tritici]|uniref:Peptidase S9A N-terminal domain-containing protein n=1 Tax=Puccinia graminis f. sp. tritici TaxID=56615 RepID=A0A5B0N3K6_PUCGR|nr:hypothetical protein PGT21_023844 [Puccinia graminis f. sp. tritici]KAA1124020.1 hypothetical protein PGTUg99_020476 [Puccinia graminis f. sp. tritici]